MKFSISNIALPAFDHADDFGRLVEFGLDGIEVAPSRVWRDTWHELTTVEVFDYRQRIENAGLGVVGLPPLFYDPPELGLFTEPALRVRSPAFLHRTSKVCRAPAGRTPRAVPAAGNGCWPGPQAPQRGPKTIHPRSAPCSSSAKRAARCSGNRLFGGGATEGPAPSRS